MSGFFSLAPKDEIKQIEGMESQLAAIENEFQRSVIFAGILEQKEFYQEAASKYQEVFKLEPLAGIAHRIASCYDRLELEELRDCWNREVIRQNEMK